MMQEGLADLRATGTQLDSPLLAVSAGRGTRGDWSRRVPNKCFDGSTDHRGNTAKPSLRG
jgi:hypothetical protein